MVILFVCMGNTYRSRLAEAYLKSLDLRGVTVFSAGVGAKRNFNGDISTYAKEIIHENNLDKYSKPSWTQLTQAGLDSADIVVCMNRRVYSAAREASLQFPPRTFVWDIPDVEQLIRDLPHHRDAVPHISRITFERIKKKVDSFTTYLRRPKPKELVDIYLPDGTPMGRQTDIDSIHTKGLWHQGVHAAVVTHNGLALFQKRSTTIIANPGLWDFTMGGILSAGESPEDGLMRELGEEMGIEVERGQLNKLFVYRSNHFLPSYGLHSRAFVHTYLITLNRQTSLHLQSSEVADAKFLPLAEAKRFIFSGKSRLGETTPTHQYFRRLFEAAAKGDQDK